VSSFKEILEGKHDDIPERAFLLKGTIDEVVEAARGSRDEKPRREDHGNGESEDGGDENGGGEDGDGGSEATGQSSGGGEESGREEQGKTGDDDKDDES
jgi:hypothetical protein